MFSGRAGRSRCITIDITVESRLEEAVKHDSIDTVAELRSATFVEAFKHAGWKTRGSKIKCQSQIKWFDQECETETENCNPLGRKFLITLIIQH